MTVRIVPARSGKGWEYDLRLTWPEGGRIRERGKAPLTAKDAARRWAEARERSIAAAGKAAYRSLGAPAPVTGLTFADLWPRVVRDHYQANRKKASTLDGAERIVRLHLAPIIGALPLASIGPSHIAAIKGALAHREPKTVNNVLTVLGRALRCAVKWGLLGTLPEIELLPTITPEMGFYEREDYARLVAGARVVSTACLVLVLLAGSAGLRRGEIRALLWTDVDFQRRQVRIDHALWYAIEDRPKGGRHRYVPLTDELVAALKAHRHLGDRVLLGARGEPLCHQTIRRWLRAAHRKAGLPLVGNARREKDRGAGIHRLRHTFCSHLAMSGAPAKAIQELAGHADLKTTLRYMHLSPGDKASAIAGLQGYVAAGAGPTAAKAAV